MSDASDLADTVDTAEDLYEYAPCGYLSMTPDGIVTRVNATFATLTGFPAEAIVGTPFTELLDAGARLFYETRLLTVLRLKGEVREVAITLRRAVGPGLSTLVNADLVYSSSGAPRAIRMAVFDSTSRHDYERELLSARRVAESSEGRVRVLQDASIRFGECDTEQELAETLVDVARKAFSASAVAVLTPDEMGYLRVVAGNHPVLDLIPPDARRPGPDALADGRQISFSVGDEVAALYPEVSIALIESRHQAASVVPLLEDGSAIGALAMFFARARVFDTEFVELEAALGRQAAQVLRRIRLQQRLVQIALYDQLTGLATRKLVTERLELVRDASIASKEPMCVIFLDLDGFKAVNDRLGHTVGDVVLRQISARLRAGVRESDLVGRFGGDEFVVICARADAGEAARISERLRAAVEAPLDGLARGIELSLSAGIAVYEPDAASLVDADRLLSIADAAMYESKNAGKNRATVVRV